MIICTSKDICDRKIKTAWKFAECKGPANECDSAKNMIIRTCWTCNPAHEHLKTYEEMLACLVCGNMYIKGKIIWKL